MTKARATALVDPKGWNISLSSAGALSSRANELLIAQHAKKFSLNADDSDFINFTTLIRNYLSHRSDSSRQELKDAIDDAKGTNAFLKDGFTNISVYLKSKDSNGDTRAILIIRRLIQIADQL